MKNQNIGLFLFPFFAAIHLIYALTSFSFIGSLGFAAIAFMCVELITFWDNFIIAIGNRVGIGARLERLNWARFFFHGTFISLLLPVYLIIGQRQGLTFFDGIVMQVIICVFVVAIACFGYITGFNKVMSIVPTNYFGCLRYAQSVTELTALEGYEYTAEQKNAKVIPPLAAILTTLLNLILSVWIGFAVDFWLPFIATAIIFSAASFPFRRWGALLTSAIEIIYSGILLYALGLCI
jgi:hypothetical protein